MLLKDKQLTLIFHSRRKEEKILTIWDSCEMYYTRSLMRTDVLDTALKNPAQDLGLQNIERCKGFSAHLMVYFLIFVTNKKHLYLIIQ